MNSEEALERARQISRMHAEALLAKANVIGVGIGLQEGSETEPVLVVMVSQKLPRVQLKADDLVPAEIEGVPVQVREVGEIQAQDEEEEEQ